MPGSRLKVKSEEFGVRGSGCRMQGLRSTSLVQCERFGV